MKMLEWYVVSDRGVMFHLETEGIVVGYCGGIRVHEQGRHGAFTSISQHAFWDFVLAYLRKPWLLFHVENIRKAGLIIRNVMMRMRLWRRDAPVGPETIREFEPNWGLVAIGVHADYRRQGYGSRLLNHFEDLAREDDVKLVRLSVKANNHGAIAAYERNGWEAANVNKSNMQMQKQL